MGQEAGGCGSWTVTQTKLAPSKPFVQRFFKNQPSYKQGRVFSPLGKHVAAFLVYPVLSEIILERQFLSPCAGVGPPC